MTDRYSPSSPLSRMENAGNDTIEPGPNTPTLERLAAENRSLQERVARLEVMVEVLGEALFAAKAIDIAWTRVRLETELARIRSRPADGVAESVGVASPYRDTVAIAKARCGGCKKQLERSETNIAEDGILCDRCALARK